MEIYDVVNAQDNDINENGSSQIKKIVYQKINCEDYGKTFKNLDIQEKHIKEEYDTKSIQM